MPLLRRLTSWFSLIGAVALIAGACGTDVEPTLVAAPATPTSAFALIEPTPTPSTAETTAAPTAVATSTAEPAIGPSPTAVLPPGIVEVFTPEVIATYPHDNTAYTQGLELHDGNLLESTGRQGHPGGDVVYESDLRVVDVETGEIRIRVDAPGSVFAEGLTRVGDQLIQITWKDGVAFWYDATTYDFLRQVTYDGDGWGLCYDGSRLIMTDGSARLYFRDPVSFDLIGEVPVTLSGSPLAALNELECIDGVVWANVYRTDYVVRVDPTTGVVTGVVDASALEQPRIAPTEVLNGIAWDAETATWLMTGKFWSTMYRVQFVSTGRTADPLGPTG